VVNAARGARAHVRLTPPGAECAYG
jgi:hypothetical protein